MLVMQILDCSGHLMQNVLRCLYIALEHLLERLPRQILRDDKKVVGIAEESEELGDVGMVNLGKNGDLILDLRLNSVLLD